MAVLPTVQREIFDAGMTFNHSYVSSPICCPSRTSLFTGRLPHNLADPALGWCGNFSSQMDNSFTNAIAAGGYTVGQFGKWFNEESTFCTPGWVPQWKKGPDDDFFVMCSEVKYYNMPWNDNGKLYTTGTRPEDYITSVIGNRTLQWLDKVTQNASQPWLGYVAVHAPHLPAEPAPWYINASVPGTAAPRTPNWNTAFNDKHWQVDNHISAPMSQQLIEGSDLLWARRLRTLMSVDDLVHDAVELLRSRGVLNNTYLVFTSDHGYRLGQFGQWSEKSGPYETDVHVPLGVRGPGVGPGTSTRALVTNVDLAPTLMDLAGVPDAWPDGSGRRDGVSLVPVLTSGGGAPPSPWRDRVTFEFVGWIAQWQWLAPCTFSLGPACVGDAPPAGLTNAASNCYTALRVLNATHDTVWVEFRGQNASLAHSSTNWTEAYFTGQDPWQMTNLAVKGRLPSGTAAQMSAELWEVATCAGVDCP